MFSALEVKICCSDLLGPVASEQFFSCGENKLDREPLPLSPYSEQSPPPLQIASWVTSAKQGLCECDDTHHSLGMKGNIRRQPKWQRIYFSTIHIFTPAEDLAPETSFHSREAKCLITVQQTVHSWSRSRCGLQKYFGNTGKMKGYWFPIQFTLTVTEVLSCQTQVNHKNTISGP